MQRRQLISVLGGAAILAWVPLAADAQQPNKLPRLGWLPTFAPTSPIYDGFRQGLRELGYVEGKNIIIETRWAEGNLDRLPELARELARLNVDVMLVGGIKGCRRPRKRPPQFLLSCRRATRLTAWLPALRDLAARPLG
jgi:putative ABC transport system substrate-binding protein